jgi:hypothetical protein
MGCMKLTGRPDRIRVRSDVARQSSSHNGLQCSGRATCRRASGWVVHISRPTPQSSGRCRAAHRIGSPGLDQIGSARNAEAGVVHNCTDRRPLHHRSVKTHLHGHWLVGVEGGTGHDGLPLTESR